MDSSREKPLVSVLIAAYNAQSFIGATIESVLSQTYPNLEVIVVDDGSTDGTWNVLTSFGDRIRAFQQPNGGVASARNACLALASGDFLALMDHDDLCEPERMALQMQLMESHPDMVLCSSEFSAFDRNGTIAATYSATYYARCAPALGGVAARYPSHGTMAEGAEGSIDIHYGDVYEQLAVGNFVHPPTVLFRRTALDNAPQFCPEAGFMCDWDWLVRVARAGPFGFLCRSLVRYRRSDTQISSPRYHARSAIDSMRVAERIRLADPQLYARRRIELESAMGDMMLSAAEVNVESDRRLAARLFAKSLFRFRTLKLATLRTALRLLLPSAAIHALRRMWRTSAWRRSSSSAAQMLWLDWDVAESVQSLAQMVGV